MAALFVATNTTRAIAGAWTLPEGESQHILTYRTYSTATFFDAEGRERAKNGKFTKNELQYYAEYGLGERWSAGTSLFFTREKDIARVNVNDPAFATPQTGTQTIELIGLTRTDGFARYQFYRDETYALALQPSLSIPAFYTRNTPDGVTNDNYALELAGLAGMNFALLGREDHFLDTSLAYRHRFGELGNQLIASATLGLALSDDWVVMPELQYTAALGGINFPVATITGQNDYDLTKGQLSVRYRVNERIHLQLGGFRHLEGRNTGAGGGALASVWIRY